MQIKKFTQKMARVVPFPRKRPKLKNFRAKIQVPVKTAGGKRG